MVGRALKYTSLAVICLFLIGPLALTIDGNARLNETPLQRDILIVQFGEDSAVSKASEVIQKTFESRNLAIAEKDDLLLTPVYTQYVTTYLSQPLIRRPLKMAVVHAAVDDASPAVADHRASIVIAVGHGTEDGIQDETSLVSWFDAVKTLSAAHQIATIFATCYGSKGAELVDKGFGLSGVVDAIATAHIASAVALAAFDGRGASTTRAAAQAGLERALSIASGESTPLPLIPVPDWWLPLKIGLGAVLTVAYYFVAPTTAPQTARELSWILAGVAFIASVIYLIAAGINWLLDLITPWVSPDVASLIGLMKNFTGLIASYIGGAIAAYINGGTAHPNLFTWYEQVKAAKAGQLAAETATAANPDPLTRAMFAASTAILAVSFLDLMVTFTCILIPDPPPPTTSPPISSPPSGGGSPGSTVSID